MIIVTGATGALDGATVDHLLERVAGERHRRRRCATPPRHSASPTSGIEVRTRRLCRTGLAPPPAFDGADQLVLVSSSDPKADAVEPASRTPSTPP